MPVSKTRRTPPSIARDVRYIIRSTAAKFSGRPRGPDWSPDPSWRTPHADSFDEFSPQARPYRRFGDGSPTQVRLHAEALVQTAAKKVRADRDRDRVLKRTMLESEHHSTRTWAAAELQRHRAQALRRTDVDVLRDLLTFMRDFLTAATFPSLDKIAERANVCRRTVIYALQRLRAAGLVGWVRRTTKTGSKGVAGPQRQQTSNAYYFAPEQSSDPAVRSTFKALLIAKLRRLAGIAQPPSPPPSETKICKDPELAAMLVRVGALVPSEGA